MVRLDLARRPKPPGDVVCSVCARRLPREPHQEGCALAGLLTPAYIERIRELARRPSLAIPGPTRSSSEDAPLERRSGRGDGGRL